MALSEADVLRTETNLVAINTVAEGDANTNAVSANGRVTPSLAKVIADGKLKYIDKDGRVVWTEST